LEMVGMTFFYHFEFGTKFCQKMAIFRQFFADNHFRCSVFQV
jgi:hypothetical protein